jgi:hypothetical protein
MAQPLVISSMSSTPEYAGTDLGATQWFPIAQDRIALFGRATGDTRWIQPIRSAPRASRRGRARSQTATCCSRSCQASCRS